MALTDSSESSAKDPSSSERSDLPEVIPAGVSPSGPSQLLSIPVGAFHAQVPQQLLTPKKADLARLVFIDSEDVVLDDTLKQGSILLSILSLSCPDIFAHP